MNLGDSGPIAARGADVLKFRTDEEDIGQFWHLASALNELRDIDGGIIVSIERSSIEHHHVAC